MGHSINDESFASMLNLTLNNYISLYSSSEKEFLLKFKNVKEEYLNEIVRLAHSEEDLFPEDEFLNEIQEKAGEVLFYYESSYKKRKELLKKKVYKKFTLRDSAGLDLLHEFLNRMVRLLELSEEDFVKVFPLCPLVFWDKVDDLREASVKYKRDSEKFIDCLKKSKLISIRYSELTKYSSDDEV